MSRDASGNYTLPVGSTAVAGATIDPTTFNAMTSDIASALTGSVARDGSGGMTSPLKLPDGTLANPALTFSSGTGTGLYKDASGNLVLVIAGVAIGTVKSTGFEASGINGLSGTIASAATTDLSTVLAQYITITGTTTITALGTVPAGTLKNVVFAGILTLTHNGTSLILPGSANITTAAGDSAVLMSLGSGNWKCLSYTRAAVAPATGSGYVSLGTGSGTAVAALTMALPAGYHSYQLVLTNFIPVTSAAVPALRISLDNGVSYKAGASDYRYAYYDANSSPGAAGTGGTTNSMALAGTMSNSSQAATFIINIAPGSASKGIIVGFSSYYYDNLSNINVIMGSGGYITAVGLCTNIQLLFSSGNIANYEYNLLGLL